MNFNFHYYTYYLNYFSFKENETFASVIQKISTCIGAILRQF